MAASSSSDVKQPVKSKLSQNELRRLMKEKQEMLKDKERKIDSPLAKYNSLGQLFCVVCNIQIKNELLWPAHINGKVHKQNIEILKTKKREAADRLTNTNSKVQGPSVAVKRPSDSGEASLSNLKKAKGSDDNNLPSDFFDNKPESQNQKPVFKTPMIVSTIIQEEGGGGGDDDDDDYDDDQSQSYSEEAKLKLPTDDKEKDNDKTVTNDTVNSTVGLPEGFFDDPVQDAKIRKVDYKDPIEEEWERFQREIADATSKAQAIADEQEEESTVERQIDEIDEQIYNWARVDALQRRKDEIAKKQKINSIKTEDEDESADEQEFQEFLDWRAKGCWR